QTPFGKNLWLTLTTIAALLSVAKPLLGLSRKIENYQKLVIGYRSIDSQLKELVNDITRESRYSAEMIHTFKLLQRHYQAVLAEEPTEKVNDSLRRSCFDAVNRELPADAFQVPPPNINAPKPWPT